MGSGFSQGERDKLRGLQSGLGIDVGKIDMEVKLRTEIRTFSVLAAGKAMRLDEMTQEERAIEREKTGDRILGWEQHPENAENPKKKKKRD